MNLGTWVKRKDVEKNRYYGIVVGNNDPLHNNRLQIRVEKLHEGVPDNLITWFRPAKSVNSNTAMSVDVPALGTNMEVGFEDEDFYNGVYYQGLPSTSSMNDSFYADYPNFKGFKTNSGNTIKLKNNGDFSYLATSEGGSSSNTLSWNNNGDFSCSSNSGENSEGNNIINWNNNGNLEIKSSSGNKFNWHDNGDLEIESVSGNNLKWYDDGNIEITIPSGNSLKWSDNGDLDIIYASGASLILRGDTFTLNGNLNVAGNITCLNLEALTEAVIRAIPFSSHKHGGITSGTSKTDTPTT